MMRDEEMKHRTIFNLLSISILFSLVILLSAINFHQVDAEIGDTIRASISEDELEGNLDSFFPKLSEDGNLVVFISSADNLVSNDFNNVDDVFVRNITTGETQLVSVSSEYDQANDRSYKASISPDGRYIAFDSSASNLVSGDMNNKIDIFVHDRQTGITERVSVSSYGAESDGDSYFPTISSDGRYIAFDSDADNLISNDTNGVRDSFVYDRFVHEIVRISESSDGTQGNGASRFPVLTANGRFVVFESLANNLVPGDTNGVRDTFVRDLNLGQTSRVSVASDGTQQENVNFILSSAISADGRYIAFNSDGINLVMGDSESTPDIFVHDRVTGITEMVSVSSTGIQGNDGSFYPSISADGRFVTFDSSANNLVDYDINNETDVFIRDRLLGITELVSHSYAGDGGDNLSNQSVISGSGCYIAFVSNSTNIVIKDLNGVRDIFVYHYKDPDNQNYLPIIYAQ